MRFADCLFYRNIREKDMEARIFEKYRKVHVDASFPAESMYLKRGYQIISYEKMETENGDFLCYHTMEKVRGRNLSV